jgi:uroporphyrinogen III methyltransferase/synthase
MGAEPILLPLIGIAPPDDKTALINAAAHADDYDWIIFTSANAIAAFVAELPDTGDWFRPRIATIGSATREVAEEYGFRVELTPDKYIAESLTESFRAHPLDGKRILIPSAAVTRDIVPNELRHRGAEVDVVQAYQNVIPHEAPQQAAEIFQDPLPDWVTFASSSAVDHLAALVAADVLREMKIVSIGPATSATLLRHGLTVTSEALAHTIPGLIEAMRNH